jgi:hypothetical protein
MVMRAPKERIQEPGQHLATSTKAAGNWEPASIYLLRFIFSGKGSTPAVSSKGCSKWLETGDLAGRAFRAGFFSRLALGHNGRPEPGSQVFREFVKLGIAIDFDGLLGGISDHVAVVAPSQMFFKLGFGARVNYAVQIIG